MQNLQINRKFTLNNIIMKNLKYQNEAQEEITYHKKIYRNSSFVTGQPSILLKYIIKSIDAYDKEYLEEFDRDILIAEIKKQLNIN